jgi:HlyD family secretion protein
MTKQSIITLLLVFGINLFSCSTTQSNNFIGSAVVETQTFQIATTAQGQILGLYKNEGQAVNAGELVAVLDTVPLVLRLAELSASINELSLSISAKKTEIASQESDANGIEREYKRTSSLVEQGSLPSVQKDNLETQVESSGLRIKANQSNLSGIGAKISTLLAQKATIQDQLKRCYVHSQNSGIVITKYKNTGEVVLPGNPILEIAQYDTMQIDFFVPQYMLAGFKIGQTVRIRIDTDKKQPELFVPATISWISNDAEFSPKNIQTRENRNELVFKIRCMAANKDLVLKRGMPVEIWR